MLKITYDALEEMWLLPKKKRILLRIS